MKKLLILLLFPFLLISQNCEEIYINYQQYSLFEDQFNIFGGQDVILVPVLTTAINQLTLINLICIMIRQLCSLHLNILMMQIVLFLL